MHFKYLESTCIYFAPPTAMWKTKAAKQSKTRGSSHIGTYYNLPKHSESCFFSWPLRSSKSLTFCVIHFLGFCSFLHINTETSKHNLKIFEALWWGKTVIFKEAQGFPAFIKVILKSEVSREETFTFISRYPLLHAYLYFKGVCHVNML